MANPDATCWTVVFDDAQELPTTAELRQALEKGSDDVKLETLRRIIIATQNGQPQPALLMPIIQYVLPSKNKALKKLLHFYWEVCPKYDDNGKLKQEMILVCNAIRNDLQHPNEYVRGATLRFLQKLTDAELLEPLVPTARACLEHRHSYVRKNAVFAILTIHRNFEHLVPDAPELVQTFLAAESDMTCKRNAFVCLSQLAPEKAAEYLLSVLDQVPNFDELLQLSVIDFIRRETKDSDPSRRARYIRCILELLNATSHSVKYEAATGLTSLTQNPAAVKAAASCLIELAVKESDNNVKLIVLDRLETLRAKHEHVLDSLVMDMLRILSSPDMEVRRKAIGIALAMITSRNVEDVVLFLKKQLSRTLDNEFEKNAEYRQLLIQSIHVCAIRFSEVAANVVHSLMEFLGDASNSSAIDVIAFVREVVEKFPGLRKSIVEKLMQTFGEIKSGKVFRGALWIAGEYASDTDDILEAFQEIRKVLGEIPILASEQRLLDEAGGDEEAGQSLDGTAAPHKPRLLPDGTYATETAFSTTAAQARLEAVKAAAKPPLRALILGGDFYTGVVLATTLTKLVMRFSELAKDKKKVNVLRAEAMLIMTSVVRVGQSKFSAVPIDEDSQERILNCVETLAQLANEPVVKEIFLTETKAVYAKMVATEERKAAEKKAKETKASAIQADDLITFRQFSKKSALDGVDDYEQDVTRATGSAETSEDLISDLSRVVQLTGFSDPVYAEALIKVHGFDILLDVLIVNQSSDTLQNMCVEFATLGDLKLVERPTTHTVGPHSFLSVKATIKVSSTETGVIFGNIIWEAGTNEACVVLNDIHIDIMDYIKPAYCSETQFRSMWTEFEWENRVNVNTTITDLRAYLAHIMKSTNMACLTPEAALSGDCDFLSANMYARSLFGEDALANLSIEKVESTGIIQGHVRIRSKTQGIALSLGDKITLAQKAIPVA
ncbi:coatomer subunit beta [Dacryopinax primogenitus]|uniref:Coatomer subunit beta n=1 Tax=Dacryopinax primogenitus (strain DJM 731) TaxID=1858805 RepID=M5G3M9_DACPD|nr:coatomer subunit beta [Dacryopinax primogenitus]EJU02825.1 coatomer subunit beta [Dacryopinax primogenitus]